MNREIKELSSKYSKVRVKTSRFGKFLVKCYPEFEDCKKIAQDTSLPLREIMDEVRSAARRRGKNSPNPDKPEPKNIFSHKGAKTQRKEE